MSILIENRQKRIKIDRRRVRTVLKKILKSLQCETHELSLVFVDNQEIREINRLYLNRDRPTNVIAFSLSEGEFGDINPQMLGDIVISAEKALADAQKGGMGFEDEIDYLMIHGLLHLTGYDHENTTADEKKRMKNKEREIFFLLRGYSIS